MSEPEIRLRLGNEAVAEGAIAVGCRFFGGYPITPSTEVAELMSRRLPQVGGVFIQMEDEMASLAAVIGSSIAGVKSMTATSGPGFSLMQEHIGYAYITETACVVVNVQRGGPSTGLPTKVSQSDVMQARWGPHGDYTAIVLTASSVASSYEETIRAFNLAERFRTPVVLLTDEVIGHMREKLTLFEPEEVVDRVLPGEPGYVPFGGPRPDGSYPMGSYHTGVRFHVTGLTHDEMGVPSSDPAVTKQMLDRLRNKITSRLDEIVRYETVETEDANVIVVAFGIVARSAKQAVLTARSEGLKAGLIEPRTLWPFHEELFCKTVSSAKTVVVAELNMGMYVHEVERVCRGEKRVVGLSRYDSEMLTPVQILDTIREVAR
jgi:2-oxoglutarate ferredoxin oxidoreductase subunit alpha